MNLIAHKRPKTLVNKLMSSDRPLAVEFTGNDQRFEMCVVATRDLDDGIVKSGLNQAGNLRGFHGALFLHQSKGAQCNRKFRGFPMPHADCV